MRRSEAMKKNKTPLVDGVFMKVRRFEPLRFFHEGPCFSKVRHHTHHTHHIFWVCSPTRELDAFALFFTLFGLYHCQNCGTPSGVRDVVLRSAQQGRLELL